MNNISYKFIVICLLSALSQICLSQTKAGFADQFISSGKNKIEVVINNKTIQLKSPGLDGFSQCRPYLAWRNEGDGKWTEDFPAGIEKTKVSDKETKLTCLAGPVVATINVRKLEENILELSGSIKNKSAKTIEMARFHYLHGTIDNHNIKFFGNIPEGFSFKVVNKTDTLDAPRLVFEKMWKAMGPDYPMLSNPIHDEANWAVSLDIGVFSEALNKPGWFIGFTGPGTAYGEVGFKTQADPSPFFAGVLLDNIILEPDSTRVLEKCIIYAGDWQDGKNYWVTQTAKEFKVKPQTKSLMGFSSTFLNKVSPEIINRANTEFGTMPVPPGGRTIQIDQAGAARKEYPKMMEEKGNIPGVWIGPTGIGRNNSIITTNPEMIQRLPDGSPAINFTGKLFLEIDRPDSKEYIKKLMTDKVQEGWRYFKVDFTYPISTARVAYDRKKTLFQTNRDLYKLIRKACGPDILINSCLGTIDRYPLGYVDIDRIAGDTHNNWNSVLGNIGDLLSRACTNGYWWQADPDLYFMRKEDSSLNEEESFLITGTVGLIGGIFLTSDVPSQWSPEARKIIDAFWTIDGPRIPARHFVCYGDNNAIKAYLVSYNDGRKGPQHKVGIYNWSEKPETIQITLEELRFKPGLKWKAEPFIHNQNIKLQNNSIVVGNMPPHSLRIIDLYLE